MDIAPANVGNDTILARLGLQQIGAPPIVAQPIRPQGAVVEQPHLQAMQPSGLVQQSIPPQPPVVQLQPVAVTPHVVVAPKVELPEKCCAKCSYFRSRVVAGGAIMIGNKPSASEEINECRRYPPKDNGMGHPTFSRVPKGEWCGEYKPDGEPISWDGWVKAGETMLIDDERRVLGMPLPKRTQSRGHPPGQTAYIHKESILEQEMKATGAKGGLHVSNSPVGNQSQPSGVGENLPKKRGRPAKGISASSGANQAQAAAESPKRRGRPARKQEGA